MSLPVRSAALVGLLFASGASRSVAWSDLAASPPAPARGAAAERPAGDDAHVRFRDRLIDLRPFIEGFPYKFYTPDYASKRFFYLKDEGSDAALLWQRLPRTGKLDLAAGRPALASPVNWNARTVREMEYHPSTDSLVILADEKNDEVWNLYRLSLSDGSLSKVTDKPYLYGAGLDAQKRYLAYLPRYGKGEPYRSCLNLLDWQSGREEEVLCDSPELLFTWGRPIFRPDGAGVLVRVNERGDRKRKNVAWLDLSKRELEVLTDRTRLRSTLEVMKEWLDGERFLYLSDEDGFANVYLYNLRERASKALTSFADEITSWAPLAVGGKVYAAVVLERPHECELVVVDPDGGAEVLREVSEDNLSILDHHGERLYVQRSSVRTYLRIEEWRFEATGQRLSRSSETRVEPPAELLTRLEHCHVERVRIPTFDVDSRSGKTRELHAYLYTPLVPPVRPEERFALITAFYGGENHFDAAARIVGAAGGISLSPAVRGSNGFGREFFSLNDGDLGGNEIIDVIYCGRYLAQRFSLAERQIGVWGSSHGGYAAMRLLTFPRGVNGRDESFDWGFGIAHAGFSNILTFYRSCNIPDWVKLEAGDPVTEAKKLLDRSPISHLEELKAPLLLTHGENDQRVPVRESRQFAEKAVGLEKPVTYVEFPGQGHGLKGIPNQKGLWQARFTFLEKALHETARAVGGVAAAPAASKEEPLVPLPAGAEEAARAITAQTLAAPVRFLSDDLLEGRGPATRGDRLARLYLAAELEAVGLEPGASGGSWEQPFEVVGVDAGLPAEWTFRPPRGDPIRLRPREDYVAASGVQVETAEIRDSELVFVGYGITAPEYEWDDFKGADLKGKTLVMLNNDPDWDPKLFEGKRRLYYGRWTYKFESAARQRAPAAVIIHTTPSAGYPWQVVRSSWTGEQFGLPARGAESLQVASWVTEESARRLLGAAGHDLEKLAASARSREFRPVPLGIMTSLTLKNKLSRVTTANVLGLLRGSDPRLKEEVVIYTAHHDHLGIGEPDAKGDRIYNGALDNAAGCAQVLAIARAYRALPAPPRRSILFLFVAAEEQGLLGSQYYSSQPTFPAGRIAANINFDGANIWGRSREVAVIGLGKSTLDRIAEVFAARQGRTVRPDPFPDRGFYYRSDQFNFAKIGVPALYLDTGTEFRGHPEGWGKEQVEAWEAKHYHQPSDELNDSWSFEGMVEDARLGFFAGLAIAQEDGLPSWVPGDEFEPARKKALAEIQGRGQAGSR